MSRKLTIFIGTIIAAQTATILVLGISPLGSLLSNSVQTVACGLAVACAVGAYRRAQGLARPFWVLIGLALATWGFANLGWIYYENWLQETAPTISVVRFVFDSQGVFFATALFLDKDRDSARFDLETLLDMVQIGIVFFAGFFGLYYVQVLQGDLGPGPEAFMAGIYQVVNVSLTIVSVAVMLTAPTIKLRKLYGGLTVLLLINAVFSGTADYVQSMREVPTGTWYDFGWTLPFLGFAVWASRWKEIPGDSVTKISRTQSANGLVLKHVMLAGAPLTALALLTQLGAEWRILEFLLLGTSIACYAARLGFSEFRKAQATRTLRQDTQAMDSAIDGMAIIDCAGKHAYANPAFARMMGYQDPRELLGRRWQDCFSKGDVAPVLAELRQSLRKTGKWFGALTIHHRDGGLFPMEVAITQLPEGGVVCLSRDITDRQHAEKARIEAEAKYRTLVEQVAAISYIAEVGVHGEWLYVSPQIEMMFGFTLQEWMEDSKGWTRHVHPEDHALIETAEEAYKRGERYQAEYRVIRKDGRVIWVSDTAVVAPGNKLRPVMEGIIVDITERKHLETQLQQSRKMEAVGRLAGGIAHDFNNLLTIIKGYTELALARGKLSPELRTDIERIEDASERAAGLVRQLLAFSRRQVLQPKVLDLNAIVLGLDKLLRRLMDEDIEMLTLPGKDIGRIKADPGQVEQVIMNLVVNARDAMPNGGRLTIETSNVELDGAYARDHATVRPGNYVQLTVSDNGVGMSPDTVAHIFEPFYTTKESGRGTGLGLSTVYGIVKQSGGYIWVYSEPDHGTTFKVYLPQVEQSAEPLPEIKVRGSDRKGTETMLLVEDDAQVRELARTVLVAQGYFVIEAASAEDAVRICESDGTHIQLLLTDVIMPGMSGRELAKRVTSSNPMMRVLYMSGYTYNVIASGGTLEPGVAFLQKPFTPAALLEKVREVLDAAQPVR